MTLASSEPLILGSLTSADTGALGDAARRLLDAGVDGLHVDIADGVFVPMLSFGPRLVAVLRERSEAMIDVHLMVCEPERIIPAVADAGATRISFHLEATRYPWRVASVVRHAGAAAGVALNPITPLDGVASLEGAVEVVNLLTTDPDLDGERLLAGMCRRVGDAATRLPAGARLEVDGGIDADNIASLAAAGATDFVVGRAICGSPDWSRAVRELRSAASRPPDRGDRTSHNQASSNQPTGAEHA